VKTIVIIVSIIIVMGLSLYGLAPHVPNPPKQTIDRAALEAYLQTLTAAGDPPGLSVTVMQAGGLVYNAAFGLADGPNDIPATPETVYHWWSMTKMATATAILQLHEQGQLHIDDPVTDYLSFFQVDYPTPDSPPITIRHLLNHTSGLPDTIPAMIGWVHTADELVDQTALVQRELPNYRKLRFAPGSDSAYSNLGYMVLGALIEAVSGESYEAYVAAHIVQPLHMTRTGFVVTSEMGTQEAAGSHPLVNLYTPMLPFLLDMDLLIRERTGTRYWFHRIYIDATPPTGLIGPAADAAKLAMALSASSTLLAEESLAWMRPHGAERPLGWADFGVQDGRNWVQHRGGGPGFAAIMRLYPDEQLVIVIIANGTNLDGETLVELIANTPGVTR
jgi:CubicO group peptidase (beta-lactamase class C family)